MAPVLRRRYSRIPVGYVEALPAAIAQASPSASALLLWLLLSPFRRTLPGVVRAGELTLADALHWKSPALKRCLSTLEAHGLVLVDRETRVISCCPRSPMTHPAMRTSSNHGRQTSASSPRAASSP